MDAKYSPNLDLISTIFSLNDIEISTTKDILVTSQSIRAITCSHLHIVNNDTSKKIVTHMHMESWPLRMILTTNFGKGSRASVCLYSSKALQDRRYAPVLLEEMERFSSIWTARALFVALDAAQNNLIFNCVVTFCFFKRLFSFPYWAILLRYDWTTFEAGWADSKICEGFCLPHVTRKLSRPRSILFACLVSFCALEVQEMVALVLAQQNIYSARISISINFIWKKWYEIKPLMSYGIKHLIL